MIKHSPQTIVIKANAIRLVRRADSRFWQAHYKIEKLGRWMRIATGTDNVKEASEIAEDKWYEAKLLAKNNNFVVSKKFKAIAEIVLRELQEKVQMDRTKRGSNNDYIRAINTYLIPFYGNYNIDRITQLVVNDFHIWRHEKIGRELSHSAQANHNAAMNLVLNKAIEMGNLLAMQKPMLKNTGEASNSRPDFTQDELKQLFSYMPEWILLGRKGREREIRELLCLYVGFAATTGTRTGTEMMMAEWRNLNIKETNAEPVFYIILQKGKTVKKNKPQTVVLHRSCVLYLEKLKKFNPKLKDQSLHDIVKARHADLVFQLSDGTQPKHFIQQFKKMLIEANLLYCAVTGKVRTLYSLRHYAITQAIERGLTAEQLQPQYRTGATMIAKYYNHLDPLKNADYFTGEKGADGAREEEISRLLNNVPNDPMLGLAEMSTGLQMQLVNINKAATDDIRQALQSAANPKK
jgi:integrase